MSRRKAICSKIFSVDWFPWCRHPYHCCFQATLETSLNRVGRRRTQSAFHTSKEPTQPTSCTSLEPGQTSLQRGRWLQGTARCTPLSWTSCLGIVCYPENSLKGQIFVPYSVAGLLSVQFTIKKKQDEDKVTWQVTTPGVSLAWIRRTVFLNSCSYTIPCSYSRVWLITSPSRRKGHFSVPSSDFLSSRNTRVCILLSDGRLVAYTILILTFHIWKSRDCDIFLAGC